MAVVGFELETHLEDDCLALGKLPADVADMMSEGVGHGHVVVEAGQ